MQQQQWVAVDMLQDENICRLSRVHTHAVASCVTDLLTAAAELLPDWTAGYMARGRLQVRRICLQASSWPACYSSTLTW